LSPLPPSSKPARVVSSFKSLLLSLSLPFSIERF
jgi:hypothetical protein